MEYPFFQWERDNGECRHLYSPLAFRFVIKINIDIAFSYNNNNKDLWSGGSQVWHCTHARPEKTGKKGFTNLIKVNVENWGAFSYQNQINTNTVYKGNLKWCMKCYSTIVSDCYVNSVDRLILARYLLFFSVIYIAKYSYFGLWCIVLVLNSVECACLALVPLVDKC